MTPFQTVRAPMLSDGMAEVSALGLKAAMSSVRGVKVTEAAGPAALVERQTPPPVVPTRMVLPVASDGSMAMDDMRPVTVP
jgi:hypothetical protein